MRRPDFYYADAKDRRVGPFTEEDLRTMLDAGLITPNTLTSRGNGDGGTMTPLSSLASGRKRTRLAKGGLPSRPQSSNP